MAFSRYSIFRLMHVYTQTNAVQDIWFQGRDNWRNPLCRPIDPLDDILSLKFLEFLFHCLPQVKRNTPVSLGYMFHTCVNVKFHLAVLQLPNTLVKLSVILPGATYTSASVSPPIPQFSVVNCLRSGSGFTEPYAYMLV